MGQNSLLKRGLIFDAPLSSWDTQPGPALTSGALVVGKVYVIGNFVAGDSFTNVGATNVSGNKFICTGTTPTTWTNGSLLRLQNYGTRDKISGIAGVGTDVYNVIDRQGSGRRSYDFDGVNDYVSLTPPSITSTTSIMLKIKTGAIGTIQKIICNITTAFCYQIYISSNGKLVLDVWQSNGTLIEQVCTTVLTPNTDYAIQLIADGTHVYLMVNGVLDSSLNDYDGTIRNTGTNLILGRSDAAENYFSGFISMCRIFNYALSVEQIVNYSKPEYPIEWVDQGATGAELITGDNSTFASNTGWWTIAGATITLGVLRLTNQASENVLIKTGLFIVGEWYDINFTISNSTGTSGIYFGSSFSDAPTPQKVNGTYHYRLKASNTILYVFAEGTSTLDFDNLTIHRTGNVLNLNSEGMEYTSGVWADRTNSLSATVSGATVNIPPGSNLGACNFNGTTSKIAYTGMNGLTGDITLSAWIFPLSYGEAGGGVMFNNGGVKFGIYIGNGGQLYSSRDSDTNIFSASSSIPTLNIWYHVLITSTSAGVTSFYINGVLNGTANQAAGTPVSSVNYYVGNREGTDNTFDGRLSDTKIWNRILTQEEITNMYQIGE